MCGHFEARLYLHLLNARRESEKGEVQIVETRKVAPTIPAPILVHDSESGRSGVAEARFGLVPFWYHGAIREWKASTFNARVEEAPLKRAFQGPWKYRRCVVPADAFNEWSGPKNDRRKWRITRADNQPLAFAGLWDEAQCADGDVISFCILTRAAGGDMRAIHDREPVMLEPDVWESWMRTGQADLYKPVPLRLTEEARPPKPGETLSLF
jgi:putative SOS response-associated peptidase YedK